jgi:hypothetical protein
MADDILDPAKPLFRVEDVVALRLKVNTWTTEIEKGTYRELHNQETGGEVFVAKVSEAGLDATTDENVWVCGPSSLIDLIYFSPSDPSETE